MTTEKVKNYFKKYTNDIRNGKKITEKEIFEQIKDDFELFDKEENKEVWAKEEVRIKKLVRNIIRNRTSDKPSHIRISMEHLNRSMIRAMFPKGKLLFIKYWNKLNEENAQKDMRKHRIEQELKQGFEEIKEK